MSFVLFPYSVGDAVTLRGTDILPAQGNIDLFNYLKGRQFTGEVTYMTETLVQITFQSPHGLVVDRKEIMLHYIVPNGINEGSSTYCYKHVPVNVGFNHIKLACAKCDKDLPEDYKC